MSSEPAASAAEKPVAWPVLSTLERRVLGVLVEKAKSTPDIYPLSLNSLVTGCNQKSNRDPVLNASDLEVEDALASAQKQGLVIKITGGRVERWRHILYEVWGVEKVELAVLAELLLRGPQTEGELRARASRMEPIADLDALRPVLRQLAERRLIVYLTPEGRRGTVLTHGFHGPDEWERLRAGHRSEAESVGTEEESATARSACSGAPAALPTWEARLNEANAQITNLQGTVSELEAKVANLAQQVHAIREGLGM
jgi:uncharacterized protein YceH (UPF0502 family)